MLKSEWNNLVFFNISDLDWAVNPPAGKQYGRVVLTFLWYWQMTRHLLYLQGIIKITF